MDDDPLLLVDRESPELFCGCKACVNLRRLVLAALAEEAAVAKVPSASMIDWRGVVDDLASDNPEDSKRAERLLSRAISDPRRIIRVIHREIALS